MKVKFLADRISAFVFLIAFTLPASAQVDGVYKANGGDRWLHVRQVDREVFILGEMQQNVWTCRRTGTTPATESTAATTSCVEDAPSDVRPSTFVFVGARRGSNLSGSYYFVPKGRDVASGQATFRYGTTDRGQERLTVSGGGLAQDTYTKMLNGDSTPVYEYAGSPAHVYRNQRKWMFAPVQEAAFDFSLDADDLTDIWTLDDGTTVYLRQYGNTIAWLAEHQRNGTAIVGIGERNGDVIDMRWSGVPRSQVATVRGSGRFRVENAARLRRVSGNRLGDGVLHRRGSRRSVLLTDLFTDPGNIMRANRPWAPGGDKNMTPTENLYGDREFDGNGPRIVVDVELRPVRNRIFAEIEFTATETGGDGSVGHGRWSYPVYTAPPGRTIARIHTPMRQRIEFISDDGANAADNWSPSEASHQATFPAGNLLASYWIFGDTRGDDISTDLDPKDDTHIRSLAFHPALVELSPLPDTVVSGGSNSAQTADMSVPPIIESAGERATEYRVPPVVDRELNPRSGPPPLVPSEDIQPMSTACRDALQGRVAWNYEGATTWGQSNLDRMCAGAGDSTEPARCFQVVMHGSNGEGGVNYGSGNRWEWQNALALCAGTRDAGATVTCFRRQIGNGAHWRDAIARCNWAAASARP